MAYLNSLPEVEKKRYLEKLKVVYETNDPEALIDPYEIPDDKWVNDFTAWPPVEFGEIYAYLVDTPGQFTREKMKAYKSLDAFNYYISGWVKTVFIHHMGSNCLLKAIVTASQSLKTEHKAWVGVVKKTGTVITGHCTCMAGCGEVCSHIAALLFTVEAIFRHKVNDEHSCTDKPCEWNQAFSKKVQSSKAVDILFFKPNKKRTLKETQIEQHEETKKRRMNISPPKPKLSPTKVYNALFKCQPDAAIFSILPQFSQPCQRSQDSCLVVEPNLPTTLHSLYDSKYHTLTNPELKQLCSKVFQEIKITKEEAEFLQKATINQSQCLTWYEHRKGRITASHFYDVCRHIQNPRVYPTSIVKKIMQYYSSTENVAALKWGREKEDCARDGYISGIKSSHENFIISQCGLVIDPQNPFLGASPDGMVCCTCCGKGALEIKCPFKYRDLSPTDNQALSDPQYFLKKNTNGDIYLSSNHKYYYQVQGQIALCDVAYCDFVCWTGIDIYVERIKIDEDLIKSMIPQLKQFFLDYLLPELLTNSLFSEKENITTNLGSSNKKKARLSKKKSTEKLYCVCRKPEYGQMIACDNPDCSSPDDWYHFKCVGLKYAPCGEWYCSQCMLLS